MHPGSFLHHRPLSVGLVGILLLWVSAHPLQAAKVPLRALPFQDGSVVFGERQGHSAFAFPYLACLSTEPAWNPAYPRELGQPVEPVLPLAGLAGVLSIEETGADNEPIPLSFRESGGDPGGSATWNLDSGPVALQVATGLETKGALFILTNTSDAPLKLRVVLERSERNVLWATPQAKRKRNWGFPSWHWEEELQALLQSYSNPLDATHDPHCALWFDQGAGWKFPTEDTNPDSWEASLELPAKESARFGFVHADSRVLVDHQVRNQSKQEAAAIEAGWASWKSQSLARIGKKFPAVPAATAELSMLRDSLVRSRQLFLSNGGVLSHPLQFEPLPVSVRAQGIVANHWVQMGLDLPRLETWKDLATYNPTSERSLPIGRFSGHRLTEVFGRGGIPIVSPDPDNPPSREEFNALLGSVVGMGHLTLVDGVHGFRGKPGWWTEAGFEDLADYALKTLGVPIASGSREILDEKGLDPRFHTLLGAYQTISEGTLEEPRSVEVETPEGGFLFLHPQNSEDLSGVHLASIRWGSQTGTPFSKPEAELLADSHGMQRTWNRWGEPTGRVVTGEGYLAYRLPEDPKSSLGLTLSGAYRLAWGPVLPATEVVLQKKAYQDWFLRELLTVPVSRLAHPVVYGATWGARIFDVTGTTMSPILYHRLGKGTFVWIGLQRDYLLLGSDTGTDAQNPLRSDPCYDLLRATLALHDPDQAGGQQASAPPNAYWDDAWNQATPGKSPGSYPYFAFLPSQLLGTKAGGAVYWGATYQRFYNTLFRPHWEGLVLEDGDLIVESHPSGEQVVTLATNAFWRATYLNLSRMAGYLKLNWWSEFTRKKADAIETQAVALLDLESASPVFARSVRDGTVAEAIPVQNDLLETVWAVSELSSDTFPGNKSARNQVLSVLKQNLSLESWDDRALAALATVDPENRSAILDRFLSRPRQEWLAEDLDVVVPTLHAMCLRKATLGTSE